MTEDDKKYLKEELQKLKTYTKSRDVAFLMDKQYEGWYPEFHRYHDKRGGKRKDK